MSYLGAGIDTQWAIPAKEWAKYENGGISLFLKCDKPTTARLELRCEGEAYSISIPDVDPTWRKISIPFSSFSPSGKKLDFKATSMKQLVIVPEKMDTLQHFLGVDEITLLATAPALLKADSFEFKGRALAPDGKPLPGAKVFLFADDAFTILSSTSASLDGVYQISGKLSVRPYAAEPEFPAPPAKKLFLAAKTDSFNYEIKPVDSTGAEKLDFKLAPFTYVQTTAELPDSPVFTPVSKDLFGVNVGIWSLDSVQGSKEMQAAMREAGISVIRFPGGGRSDEQLWTRDNSKLWFEKATLNGKDFAGYLTPAHIDKFAELCKAINAKPYLTINARNRQPELAADIVKYANVERKYAIPYWEIGNEPEGWYGWKHDQASCEKIASGYSETYKPYYEALKAVDPSIKCAGPVSANKDYYDTVVKSFLASCGKTADIVAIHRYPQDDDDPKYRMEDAKLFQTTGEWSGTVKDIAEWSKAGGGPEKPLIAVTEWNTSFLHPGQRTVGLPGALWTFDNIAEMALNGIGIGCFWCLENANYSMFEHKDGTLIKRPAFHAFKLMSSRFSKGICRGVSGNPLLKTYFGESASSRCVLLINDSPDMAFEGKLSAGTPFP